MSRVLTAVQLVSLLRITTNTANISDSVFNRSNVQLQKAAQSSLLS